MSLLHLICIVYHIFFKSIMTTFKVESLYVIVYVCYYFILLLKTSVSN